MTASQVREHRIEYEPLDQLVKLRFPGNPKKHHLQKIKESVDENGFVAPLLVDDASNLLGYGHGRLMDLVRRRDGKEPNPLGIKVDGATWLVPVVRGVRFKSKRALEKYVLADNATTIAGGYDDGLLSSMVKRFGKDLRGSAFDAQDVRLLLASRAAWSSDIAAVNRSGEHLDPIPGKVLIACRRKDVDPIKKLVTTTLKRHGFKGVDVS